MLLRVKGGRQLQAVGRDLKLAGLPGRGLRSRMRRNIVAAVKPMKGAVKSNALAIPTHGSKHTGLRAALARSTKLRIRTAGPKTAVRLEVDHPLAPLMEGSDGARSVRWRHPVFGNTNNWVSQASHPFFAPAVIPRLPAVRVAVVAAVDETAAIVERGI